VECSARTQVDHAMRINIRDDATLTLTPEGVAGFRAFWKEPPPADTNRVLTKPLLWVVSMIIDASWIEGAGIVVTGSDGHASSETIQVTTLADRPRLHVTVDLSNTTMSRYASQVFHHQARPAATFGLAVLVNLLTNGIVVEADGPEPAGTDRSYLEGKMFIDGEAADHELLRAVAYDGMVAAPAVRRARRSAVAGERAPAYHRPAAEDRRARAGSQR
jgi:hypothetical protein